MFNTFPKVQIFLHCYIIMFICLCTCNSPMHVQVFLYAKKIELKIKSNFRGISTLVNIFDRKYFGVIMILKL